MYIISTLMSFGIVKKALLYTSLYFYGPAILSTFGPIPVLCLGLLTL